MHDVIVFGVFIGLIVMYVLALRAQDEKEYQEERWRKGYREDD